MNIPEHPSFTVARHELEASWRSKLHETQERYQAATSRYRRVLQEQPKGLRQGPDDSLAGARQAESQSLAEYARVLRIFVDLTVHRKIPEEQEAASTRGA